MHKKKGSLKNEIFNLKVKIKKDEINFETDEFPRHGSTFEKINSLKTSL